jgi:hypothetical protein
MSASDRPQLINARISNQRMQTRLWGRFQRGRAGQTIDHACRMSADKQQDPCHSGFMRMHVNEHMSRHHVTCTRCMRMCTQHLRALQRQDSPLHDQSTHVPTLRQVYSSASHRHWIEYRKHAHVCMRKPYACAHMHAQTTLTGNHEDQE